MRNVTWLLVSVLSIASPSLKAAPLSMEDASNEMSSEAAQCFAYYAIAIHCFSDRLNEANKKDFEAGQDMASSLTFLGGKKAGMSDKALVARIELAMGQLMGDMDKNCVNISVLLNKYAKPCQSLVRKPEVRLEQLQANGH